MKKFVSALIVLIFCSLIMINFTACKGTWTTIKANRSLKAGHELYAQQKYKKAIDEYEEALKVNEDLTVAYLYLGSSYSAVYRPTLGHPDTDIKYQNINQENIELQAKVDENDEYIAEFESDEEKKAKLDDIVKLESDVEELNSKLRNLEGYENYKDMVDRNVSNKRRIESNDALIKRIQEKADDEKSLEDIDVMQQKTEDNDRLLQEIEGNRDSIASYEQRQDFIDVTNEISDTEAKIEEAKNFLKSAGGYEEYLAKVKENRTSLKKISDNGSYKIKLERNVVYGEKALEYLNKAYEVYPEDENIINSLADLYDKMGDFEESKKFYMMILEKGADKPDTYYTLANFYARYGKHLEAEEMYKKATELNPTDPAPYLFYAEYMKNKGQWNRAVEIHEKRIVVFMNPEKLSLYKEIDETKNVLNEIDKKTKYIESVQKNKAIPKKTRDELTAKAREEIAELGNVEDLKKALDEKNQEIKQYIFLDDAAIAELDPEKVKMLSESLYRIGYMCWLKSYQTEVDMMVKKEREELIKKGMESLEMSMKVNPDFPNPLSIIGLLWREMIKINPMKSEEYIEKNQKYMKDFVDAWNKKRKREEYQKELERLGQD